MSHCCHRLHAELLHTGACEAGQCKLGRAAHQYALPSGPCRLVSFALLRRELLQRGLIRGYQLCRDTLTQRHGKRLGAVPPMERRD